MVGVKLAYYRKEDWDRFIDMIDDRESMHDTWNDWDIAFKKAKKHLISQGFEVLDVIVDLNELSNYCFVKGLRNDGYARSKFVQSK